MSRQEIMEQLLKLIGQTENLDTPRLAGEYSGVPPETKRELTGLWGDALLTNTWLVPEKVAEFAYQDYRDWVRISTGHFLLGYMLANREHREQAEIRQPTEIDLGATTDRDEP